ncbi:MAG: T9SS type B sorting domain-containing protein [Saprospiraceae bacterium]|nr:T9SS type B sorting domain-containing protein [Saprospiraceae bacterium]
MRENQRRSSVIKMIFTSLFLITVSTFFGQIDTEFWFVAPNITEGHGDAPVVFRFTAFEQDARVVISQPANPLWSAISLTIPAGQSRSVDVTSRLDLLENKPAFRPQSKGLFIQSDHPVTVYYEVNHMFNPDIFALKGRNALGKDFFIPAQNFWANAQGMTPPATSAFDIVATADDTHILITPNVNVAGHQAGVPFEIVLQHGETYSVEAPGPAQNQQLTGSKVTADQQIAITLKHDSNLFNPCFDLAGDQIVPVDVLGTEYIVVKGFLEGGDHIFVLATEDNTTINIEGANSTTSTEVASLNAGQSQRFTLRSSIAHIKTTAPVYVVHATGFGCELGLALLPKLECTGSSSVSFTRSTDEGFGLILITKNGNQDAFTISPGQNITANLFDSVPGTEGKYVAARINLTDPPRANEAYQISNSKGVFHLGTINGGERTGTRYGYFSDFKTLKVLADASKICLGSTLELRANGSDTYYWFGDPEVEGSTLDRVEVNPDTTTTYAVIGSDAGNSCLDTAYLNVEVFEWAQPKLSVSPTCAGVEVTLAYIGIEPLQELTWIFGADTFNSTIMDTIRVMWDKPGVQSLQLMAVNPAGCATDTTFHFSVGGVLVEIDSANSVIRGEDLLVETKILDGSLSGSIFSWHPQIGISCNDCLDPVFNPETTTDYQLSITDTLGCVSSYDTRIYVESPIFVPNAFTPNQDGVNDFFQVYAGNVAINQLIIANRWGQVIFEHEDPALVDLKWDGTIEGREAESGVYIYFVRGQHRESQRVFEKKGSFHLIR